MHSAVQAIPQKMQVLVGSSSPLGRDGCWAMGWQPIETAPSGRELQLSVIDHAEIRCLTFPCWRMQDGWLNCLTHAPLAVQPTHWRNWKA